MSSPKQDLREGQKRLREIAAEALRGERVVEKLAGYYQGKMPVPFDPKYAEADEEVEATAALRKATKRARADLDALADSLPAFLDETSPQLEADEGLLRDALFDPGRFVERKIDRHTELEHKDGLEPLIEWQIRAYQAGLGLGLDPDDSQVVAYVACLDESDEKPDQPSSDLYGGSYDPRRWKIWQHDADRCGVDGPQTLPPKLGVPQPGLEATEEAPIEVMPVSEHESILAHAARHIDRILSEADQPAGGSGEEGEKR